MKLVYRSTGKEVKIGDTITDFRGNQVQIMGTQEPKHSGSTGRVILRWIGTACVGNPVFPGVIDAEWVEREDKVE